MNAIEKLWETKKIISSLKKEVAYRESLLPGLILAVKIQKQQPQSTEISDK